MVEAFFYWLVTFLLTDYFRPSLPEVTPSGEGDFQSPTATEGRKIPQVAGGTIRMKAPNCIWQGEWDAEPVTIETGVVFKRDETVGYKYSIALALGQFTGETAGMTGIWIGDDKVWDYVDDNGSVPADVADVDLTDLFGGERNGGGFAGRFRAFTGSSLQTVSSFLAARVPLQSSWPGITYVVLTDLTETAGAVIGEQNTLRDISIEWQMYDTIANGGLGNELSLTGDKHIIGRDANPISAAYKVLTDPDFSINTNEINFTNFQTIADTCYTEGLGFSMVVDSEQEASKILDDIEQHIDGYIGPNPTNGLIEVKLARYDFVPADEFQANTANIKQINNYSKPEWPQTKNEVKVRFVNRDKEYKDDHAVAQDSAARVITNRPQSITIRYPGLRDATAANRIVARVSRTYFWPKAKFEMVLDRTAYAVRPGDVAVVTHPDIDAVDLLTRVIRVRTGDPVNQEIKLDVVVDVFRDETGLQAAPPPSEHVPPSNVTVDPMTNHRTTNVPRWMFDNNEIPIEARLLFLVERDAPNHGFNLSYRTRAGAFGGNFTGEIVDGNGPFNTFSRVGTLRAIGSPEVGSPAVAMIQLRATLNDGSASVADGGGFQVDGSLSTLIGDYDPAVSLEGLAVIDPEGPNEEWVAITTIVLSGAGVECQGVIRGIGDSPIKEHYAGEEVWFIDSGAYLQENVRPSETDNEYGYQYKIQPIGPSGEGALTAYQSERRVDVWRTEKPYPPTAIIIDQLSTTVWYQTGDLDASYPDNKSTPTKSGINFEIWNRRFDQLNYVAGADSRDDNFATYGTNEFADVDPTLNWWLYDLDTTPNPTQATDAILSGTELSLDDRTNQKFFNQSVFQGIGGIAFTFNCRFEFAWENQASPGIDGVLAGTESNFSYVDRLTTWWPDHESQDIISDTLLLLHFDGADRTTQVIDYSPYNHPVTLSSGAVIDTDIPSAPLGSPDQNDGHLELPAIQSPGASPGTPYCEVTDVSPIPFHSMRINPGFIIQARIQFTVAPTGEIPIVTKWRTSDNERQFWFGLNNTTLRYKHSPDGTTEQIETTGTRTWNTGQWYEICVCLWEDANLTEVFFFVDGVWDERETMTYNEPHPSLAPVRIGSDADGNTAPETMYFDEVRIVNQPTFKAPYTQQTAPYPGREYATPLLYGAVDGWDFSPESPLGTPLPDNHSGVTEDLNRWTMDFGTRVKSSPAGSPGVPSTFIDPSQSKFGGASLYVGGEDSGTLNGPNCDGVRLSDSGSAPQFAFGKSDFTMECFVRFEDLPNAVDATNGMRVLDKFWRGASPTWGNWAFNFSGSNLLYFSAYDTSNTPYTLTQSVTLSPAITTDTWYHIAAVRSGIGLALFIEGQRVAYDDDFFLNRGPIRSDFNIQLCIGRRFVVTGSNRLAPFKGWIDEIRILNGTAEYDITQTTLTVPTAPFPRDPLPEPAPPPLPEAEVYGSNPSSWTPTNL
jgi:hypothetical protein